MAYYKKIYSLPFNDFTLTEFRKWRDVLSVVKIKHFEKITFEETIQIIYYQLAIRNYENAIFFLNKCKTTVLPEYVEDEHQVTFLKILCHFEDYMISSRHHQTFDKYYVGLFNLGEIKYEPALLVIGCISFLPAYPDELEITILNTMVRIEINMVAIKMDFHHIENVRNNMNRIKHKMEDIYHSPQLETDFCYTKKLVDLALGGSDTALLKLLFKLKNVSKEKDTSDSDWIYHIMNTDGNLKHLVHSLSDIKNLLKKKILKKDYKFCVELLDLYKSNTQHNLSGYEQIINPRDFIYLCVDQIYDHLSGACDNVEIIRAYLSFLSGTNMEISSEYRELGARRLLDLYSSGLLLFPLFGYKGSNAIYNMCKIDQYNENIVNRGIPLIVELIENYFWSRTLCDNRIVDDERFFIDGDKILFFYNLLEISNLLWKAAICIFGINLNNTNLRLSSDLLSSYISNGKYGSTTNMEIDIDMIPQIYCYWGNLIENMVKELRNLESIYVGELMEDINNIEFGALLLRAKQLCNKIQNRVLCYPKHISKIIVLLLEMDVFSSTYKDQLYLHEKYKPNGEGYSSAKCHFNATANLV